MYRSAWKTHMSVVRSGTPLEFVESASVDEDASGLIRGFRYGVESFAAGRRMTSNRVVGEADGETLHVESNGYPMSVALPPACRGPRYLHELIRRERGNGSGHSFDTLVFVPELAAVASLTVRFGETRQVSWCTGTGPLTEVTQTWELRPAQPDVQWLDAEGEVRRTDVHVPALGMVRLESCEREHALLPCEPVELMSSAVIRSPRALERPRELRSLRMLLHCEPRAVSRLRAWEGQVVVPRGNGYVEVMLTVPECPVRGRQLPVAWAPEREPYLRPTPFLECDAPLIRDLAARAVTGAGTTVTAATRIEAFVARSIDQKTLDMGFATALETAKTMRGDCSEHAVLSAAMARAAGLPSQVVVGLAYMREGAFGISPPEGLFVFHVWTEVLVAEHVWMPIDPALGRYDATHLALVKSPLITASPLADLCLPVLEIVDHLQILEVDPPDRTVPLI
jgi:hypothetical protein